MPHAIHIYNDVMQVFVNIFYLKFAQYVLNAKTDFPKLNIAIRYAIALLCTIVFLQLVILVSNPFSAAEPYIIGFQRYFMIAFSLVSYVHILRHYKRKVVLFLVGGSLFYLTGALLALYQWEIRYMMLGTAIEVFIFSLILGYRTKLIEQEKKSIEAEMTQVKLTALKAQMNPHFIFNSLNSIRAYVISSETKKASDYLNKFARLIRLILHYSSKDTISLKEELETLQLYVELEQMRYRDDFGFELKISRGVDIEKLMVPPLILQPYVENAIGHGLAPKTGVKKVLVEISKSGHHISFTIRDNGVGRSFSNKINNLQDSKLKSVAMELTRKRISLAGETRNGDENIEIIDLEEAGQPVGTEVRFKLPLQAE
jgi:LytS/YehU family sensor histidine kinase